MKIKSSVKDIVVPAVGLLGVVIMILSALFLRFSSRPQFPPEGVACADRAWEHLANASRDPDILPAPLSFSSEAIRHMRCASDVGFMQYELEGTGTDGHTFYVQAIAGGMAASGADSISEFCYKKDGVIVSQSRTSGRMGDTAKGSCAYDPNYLSQAESQYEYTAPTVK